MAVIELDCGVVLVTAGRELAFVVVVLVAVGKELDFGLIVLEVVDEGVVFDVVIVVTTTLDFDIVLLVGVVPDIVVSEADGEIEFDVVEI